MPPKRLKTGAARATRANPGNPAPVPPVLLVPAAAAAAGNPAPPHFGGAPPAFGTPAPALGVSPAEIMAEVHQLTQRLEDNAHHHNEERQKSNRLLSSMAAAFTEQSTALARMQAISANQTYDEEQRAIVTAALADATASVAQASVKTRATATRALDVVKQSTAQGRLKPQLTAEEHAAMAQKIVAASELTKAQNVLSDLQSSLSTKFIGTATEIIVAVFAQFVESTAPVPIRRPCHVCQATDHWANNCPHRPSVEPRRDSSARDSRRDGRR